MNKLVMAATLVVISGAGRGVVATEHVNAGAAEGEGVADDTQPAASLAVDEAGPARFALGVENGVVIPIGDWGAYSGVGIGALGRLEYLLSPRFAVTFRPGLLIRLSFFPAFHGGGGDDSTTELLITGGMKYIVTPELGFHAVAGVNFRTLWAETRQTGARGALMLGGRYELSRAWSIGANLLVPNLLFVEADEGIDTGVVLTVGHGFM